MSLIATASSFEETRSLNRTALRAWVVVAAASFGTAGGYGAITTISLLMAPFSAEFGWTRSEVSLAYVLLAGGAATGGLWAGRVADRLPAGPLAMAGAAIMGLCLLAVPHQKDLAAIWLLYALLGFLGFSALYAPLLAAVGLWFGKSRGLAIGIVTAGGAIGQATMPQLFEALSATAGWRGAIGLLAMGYLLVLMPVMALVRRPGGDHVRHAGTSHSARWPVNPLLSVPLLGVGAVFCCALMAVPSVHFLNFAQARGLPLDVAAGLMTMLMLFGVAGRVLAGVLADRIGSLATYGLVSAIQTASVYQFFLTDSLAPLYLVAAVFGFGFGGVMTAMVCCVRDAVPAERLGSAMSVVSLLAWAGMALGGFQGGLCADLTGSYQLSFANAALFGCANLVMLGLIGLLIYRAKVNA